MVTPKAMSNDVQRLLCQSQKSSVDVETKSRNFLYMKALSGQNLEQAWDDLGEIARLDVFYELSTICAVQHKIRRTSSSYVKISRFKKIIHRSWIQKYRHYSAFMIGAFSPLTCQKRDLFLP
jgi:hypothetical protein